jgi:hypothetical protein
MRAMNISLQWIKAGGNAIFVRLIEQYAKMKLNVQI